MDEESEKNPLNKPFHTFQGLSNAFEKISLKEKTKLGSFPNLYNAFVKMSLADWKKSTIPTGLQTSKRMGSEQLKVRVENQEQSPESQNPAFAQKRTHFSRKHHKG